MKQYTVLTILLLLAPAHTVASDKTSSSSAEISLEELCGIFKKVQTRHTEAQAQVDLIQDDLQQQEKDYELNKAKNLEQLKWAKTHLDNTNSHFVDKQKLVQEQLETERKERRAMDARIRELEREVNAFLATNKVDDASTKTYQEKQKELDSLTTQRTEKIRRIAYGYAILGTPKPESPAPASGWLGGWFN